MDKEPFRLQKENYFKEFLPVYQKLGFTPKQLFQTSIKLPFHLPFNNGICISLYHNDQSAVTFIFNSIKVKELYKAGLLTDEGFEVIIEHSIVECIYITENSFPESIDSDTDLPSHLFNICLEYLNFIISSYLITTKDTSAHEVTTRMFDINALCRFIEINNWKVKDNLLLLHHNIPYQKKIMNEVLHEKVIKYANIINKQWNPFIFPEELLLNAKRNVIMGFYKEAIIYAQISFETFIKTLLFEICRVDKTSVDELEDKFERGFLSIIKKECHDKIGGNWDITNSSSPLWVWRNKCYNIRNKIIHSGYSPGYHETIEAIDAIELCKDYVLKQIYKKKSIYPKIFEYVLLDDEFIKGI